MKSFDIVTITVNPALDKSAHFSGLVPEQKIRCQAPLYDAGGGGINVSKAISRLEGTSLAVFASGGPSGEMIKEILNKELISFQAIETKNWTRESFVAVDDNTNSQYRFNFPGTSITDAERNEIIKTVESQDSKFIVVSGSLREGLPVDFYQEIAEISKKSNSKLIVDTSGEALKKALEIGVYLIKPNVGELAKLIGVEKLEMEEVNAAAKKNHCKGWSRNCGCFSGASRCCISYQRFL